MRLLELYRKVAVYTSLAGGFYYWASNMKAGCSFRHGSAIVCHLTMAEVRQDIDRLF